MDTKNKKKTKRVVMIEANNTEVQVQKNTIDIMLIGRDIKEIKENHLKHLSEDIKKIDGRLWWIMGLILASLMGTLFL
jgi:hypothetical protein